VTPTTPSDQGAKINVAVAVGGSGSAAGNRGAAVGQHGSIVTFGAQSDGIYAQSVGGGGGAGGAATSTGASPTITRCSPRSAWQPGRWCRQRWQRDSRQRCARIGSPGRLGRRRLCPKRRRWRRKCGGRNG
jgi:hypothetical protein